MLSLLLVLYALAAGPDPQTIVGPPAGPPLSGEVLEAKTKEVGSVLRCPVCQGLSVADSPSESALAMRDEVRALVAQGYDQEQILNYFEASYGEFIRLEPKTEGFGLVVWVVPLVFLALGSVAVVASLRRAPPAAPPPPPTPTDDPYLERVRKELKEG